MAIVAPDFEEQIEARDFAIVAMGDERAERYERVLTETARIVKEIEERILADATADPWVQVGYLGRASVSTFPYHLLNPKPDAIEVPRVTFFSIQQKHLFDLGNSPALREVAQPLAEFSEEMRDLATRATLLYAKRGEIDVEGYRRSLQVYVNAGLFPTVDMDQSRTRLNIYPNSLAEVIAASAGGPPFTKEGDDERVPEHSDRAALATVTAQLTPGYDSAASLPAYSFVVSPSKSAEATFGVKAFPHKVMTPMDVYRVVLSQFLAPHPDWVRELDPQTLDRIRPTIAQN